MLIVSEIHFENGSFIKTLESKECIRGKRLTDKEYKIMLETEKIRTEKNIDKIVEHIDIFENKMNKTIYATQNDDGTYRVVITNTEFESVIERADIYITAYAEKDGDKILNFTIKE